MTHHQLHLILYEFQNCQTELNILMQHNHSNGGMGVLTWQTKDFGTSKLSDCHVTLGQIISTTTRLLLTEKLKVLKEGRRTVILFTSSKGYDWTVTTIYGNSEKISVWWSSSSTTESWYLALYFPIFWASNKPTQLCLLATYQVVEGKVRYGIIAVIDSPTEEKEILHVK